MTIDQNPGKGRGGRAISSQRSVYVGNTFDVKIPLTATQWQYVARTAYHHEVAHHWGWDHQWSRKRANISFEFDSFPAATALFGVSSRVRS